VLEPDFDAFDRQLNAAADGRMRVFGIRRCGQHAVINWILRNCGRDDQVFLNSCTMGRSPIRLCGQAEINMEPAGRAWRLKRRLESALSGGMSPFVLISYEAGYPPELYAEGSLTNGFVNSDFDAEVLVTRSFVNWLPSFIRLMRLMNPDSPPEALEISNGIIFEMMRYKAHLIAASESGHLVISYDQWFFNPSYRRAMLKSLGLPCTDNGHGDVQIYGGGSSFSGHDMPAAALEINARWKTMRDDPFAKRFLHLALADEGFMDALSQSYPNDMAIIDALLSE